jgi:hypothetical protein
MCKACHWPLWSLDNETLLTSKGREYYTQEMQEKYLADIAKNMNIDNIYASYLYLYNSFHWQGSTVRSLQIMADYYQLNTDLPFWDSGLQDFLAKMPEDWGRGVNSCNLISSDVSAIPSKTTPPVLSLNS